MKTGIYGPHPEPPPLAERLTGKSLEERQEILGLACLNEAEKMSVRWKHMRHGGGYLIDDAEYDQAKSLCLRMTLAYRSSDTKKHAALAQQCKGQISTALHSDSSFVVKHAHNMQDICERMTGQHIGDDELAVRYRAHN